jgi:1,4-dihydroxy-2-naphthoate octaprenyltransferase
MAMLIAFEIPDFPADRMVGKRTIAVRLGLTNTSRLISGLLILSFLVIALLGLFSNYPGKWMIFALPMAVWQIFIAKRVIQAQGRFRYHLLTIVGVGIYILMQVIILLVN